MTRDKQICARFNENEKKIIKSFVRSRSQNVAEFIREAVFSHMNHLNEIEGNNVKYYPEINIRIIQDSVNIIHRNINQIEEEFKKRHLYKINKYND